jgi:hypothetical protein
MAAAPYAAAFENPVYPRCPDPNIGKALTRSLRTRGEPSTWWLV